MGVEGRPGGSKTAQEPGGQQAASLALTSGMNRGGGGGWWGAVGSESVSEGEPEGLLGVTFFPCRPGPGAPKLPLCSVPPQPSRSRLRGAASCRPGAPSIRAPEVSALICPSQAQAHRLSPSPSPAWEGGLCQPGPGEAADGPGDTCVELQRSASYGWDCALVGPRAAAVLRPPVHNRRLTGPGMYANTRHAAVMAPLHLAYRVPRVPGDVTQGPQA